MSRLIGIKHIISEERFRGLPEGRSADQINMLSGPGGSQVTAVFALPPKSHLR